MYPAKWSDTFVEVSFRVIESISPRKFLASNSTLFSASLLYLEFWQIDWCHIILSPGSWFSIFFEVALGRYWKSPSLIWQYWPNLLITGSLCSLTVKTNWYCSFRRMSIRFVWYRKVYGPVLHWTEGTEWIFHNNWGSFDAVTNRANHQRPSKT